MQINQRARRSKPLRESSRRLAIYDGRTYRGAVIQVGDVYIVTAANGAAIGTFRTRREAMAAFDRATTNQRAKSL
jgi:hypothetical protein